MTIRTVGILHPGEMGHVVGQILARQGLRVVAALDGRGAETRARAERAGMEDVGTPQAMVAETDAVLSILLPSVALETATAAAIAIKAAGAKPLYVDCNAVSLETSRRMGELIESAGGRYVDAAIVGPPPKSPGTTRFYASGSHAAEFAALGEHGLDIPVIGEEIGQASILKSCYASLTKGLTALAAIQLTAAHHHGVAAVLAEELRTSQPELLDWIARRVPNMPPKAHRWIAEMEEHARTFEQIGLPGGMMRGSADLYRFVASALAGGDAPPERRPELDDVVALLAGALRGE